MPRHLIKLAKRFNEYLNPMILLCLMLIFALDLKPVQILTDIKDFFRNMHTDLAVPQCIWEQVLVFLQFYYIFPMNKLKK